MGVRRIYDSLLEAKTHLSKEKELKKRKFFFLYINKCQMEQVSRSKTQVMNIIIENHLILGTCKS